MRHDGEAQRRPVGANVDRRVDVDAEEVQRARNRLHVLGRELRRVRAGPREVGVRVLPLLDGRQVRRVQLARRRRRRLDVLRRFDDRRADDHVLGEPDLRPGLRLRPDRLHGEAVAQHGVVPKLVEQPGRQLQPRRMDAIVVAQLHEGVELVRREDVLHAVRQPLGHVARVGRERFRGLARLPAADAVLQRLRQVPVIQRREGLDAVRQQLVHEPVVEIEALRVGLPAPLREHPRPRDREPVGLDAQRLHQLHVALVAVIVVRRDVAVRVAGHLARRVREGVPDRRRAAVFSHGPFDLVRRRGGAPQEPLGKAEARLRRGGRSGRLRLGRSGFPAGDRRGRRAQRGGTGDVGELAASDLVRHHPFLSLSTPGASHRG